VELTLKQHCLSLGTIAAGLLVVVGAGSGLGACAKGTTSPFGSDTGEGGATTTSSSSTSSTSSTITTTSSTTTTSTTTTWSTTTTTWTTTTTSSGTGCDPTLEFECGSGECIPAEYFCDGITDCYDASDEDPAVCGGGTWTCDPAYYGGYDGCDCGCGEVDPDCADATSASCEYCDDLGSCSVAACPGTIDPTNNAVCL
jgi:hypothetical protein